MNEMGVVRDEDVLCVGSTWGVVNCRSGRPREVVEGTHPAHVRDGSCRRSRGFATLDFSESGLMGGLQSFSADGT